MLWQRDAELTSLCSFAVPARTRYLATLEQEDELPAILEEADQRDLRVLVLGGGSNMLFTQDFPGLVLKVALRGIHVRSDSEHVLLTVAAGENWHALVQYCLQNGYHGLENLALIPGSVGAAPVQNIGAYGVELSDVLVELRYYDREQRCVSVLTAAQCELGYRDSIFKHALKNRAIILSVTLRLSRAPALRLDYPALQQALAGVSNPGPQQLFDAVCAVRRSKLPDPARLGNAGSFFRNPVITQAHYQQLLKDWPQLPGYLQSGTASGSDAAAGYIKLPAAWLIERAGWKGKRQGDAGVHEQQALVLVNHGQARGRDILQLAQAIARSVQQQFAIRLEPEVNILPASAWLD